MSDHSEDYNLKDEPPKRPAPKAPPAPAPVPVPVYMQPQQGYQPPRKSFLRRFFKFLFILLFFISIFVNIALFSKFGMGIDEEIYSFGNIQNRIAMIDVHGVINMGQAEMFHKKMQRAGEDDTVKAVVLVVDSPGGSIIPSDLMHHYVEQFKATWPNKKLYTYVEGYNASGAYWATCATDKIFATENSLVGSIGVYYMNVVVADTLQKIGVEPVLIKSTRSPKKDRGSSFRQPTEEEVQEITKDLNKYHERFVRTVSAGREISEDDTWALATGEVFDGVESVENKLIDEVGYLDDVLDELIVELELHDPMIIKYTVEPSLSDVLMSAKAAQNPLNLTEQFDNLVSTPRIQALWLGE